MWRLVWLGLLVSLCAVCLGDGEQSADIGPFNSDLTNIELDDNESMDTMNERSLSQLIEKRSTNVVDDVVSAVGTAITNGAAGAALGGAIGAGVGSAAGGVGAIPGGIAGGFFGGIFTFGFFLGYGVTKAILGDPHYRTFDGLDYDFQGTCNYVLVETCSLSLPAFRILSENGPGSEMQRANHVSSPKNIWVETYGHTVILNHDGRVIVDGVERRLPVIIGDASIYPSSPVIFVAAYTGRIILVTDYGLFVEVSGLNSLDIRVPGEYKGHLGGMLGNFDGDPDNDFLMPNNSMAPDAIAFGNSWKDASLSNPWCSDDHVAANGCDTPEKEDEVEDLCRGISDPNGPFSECHPFLDPALYDTDCQYDMCNDFDDLDFLCNAYEAYATDCSHLDIIVDWRNDSFCAPVCMKNGHYELVASPCLNNCIMTNLEEVCDGVQMVNVSGCVCDDGYLHDNGQCVKPKHCGCVSHNNHYYKQGDSWYEEHCHVICTCVGPNDVCCKVGASCPSDKSCVTQPDGSQACVCDGGPQCSSECSVSFEAVMKSQFSQGLKITNGFIAQTDTSETDPCKVGVTLKKSGQGNVLWAEVLVGVHPGAQIWYRYGYFFNRWNGKELMERGFGVPKMEVTFPYTTWDDGSVSVAITKVSSVIQLDVTCLVTSEHLLTFTYKTSNEDYLILKVDDPDKWTGICYDI